MRPNRITLAITALALAISLLSALPSVADPLRLATFNVSLNRKGPGLLYRDIVAGQDAQIANVIAIIQQVRPDILLLNEFDHDAEGRALRAFLDRLAEGESGITYPHFYAPPQNAGVPSGQDLNGNGRSHDPADAFGFGNFRGQYAMALFSRFPIGPVQDFSHAIWRDFEWAELPTNTDGSPFLSAEAAGVMRLSSKAHWDVPIQLPDGRALHILASHPTPPVFDGPEDANGHRNRDEILFWTHHIDANLAGGIFVVMGDLNADPFDGEARRRGIRALLNHPALQDPMPGSDGATEAATTQGGANRRHQGDPALDTADWNDARGPGNLRVDYVLPSRSLNVIAAGTFWPATDDPLSRLLGSGETRASDHRLVWVDIE